MAKMTDLHVADLSQELRQAILGLQTSGQLQQTGVVTRTADGIAWIYGLRGCGYGELVEIQTASPVPAPAIALSLGEDEIGAILIDSESAIRAGAKVRLTGRSPQVPVGPELLGRVVNPRGEPLDGLGPLRASTGGPVERAAPAVLDREAVHEPLATGITAVDALTPVGRGQRQLIIGDRKTGKTALAVDAIINQTRQNTGVVSIYVAIGQKLATVAALVERLKNERALDRSIIVATSPADPAALLYLAPYAGCAMGEYFRDRGEHALIIYDDLSKHAMAYRQLSLLLRRPPGREAYPGDIFYLHARLLERAAKLSARRGSGSLTALPIIETQTGDVAAYIPTNAISITDGQLYLETDLFYQGIRPAMSAGLSVSRVGSAAQLPGMKRLAGRLRIELAQFRELAAFTQFGGEVDDDTRQRVNRGRVLTAVLGQPQYQPLSVGEQLVLLIAATGGAFDQLPSDQIAEAKRTLLHNTKSLQPKLMQLLNTGAEPNEPAIATVLKLAQRPAVTKVAVRREGGS